MVTSANPILFSCSACSQALEADEQTAGQSIACPTCGAVIWIPNKPAAIEQIANPPPVATTQREQPLPHSVSRTAKRQGIFYFVFWGTVSLIVTIVILVMGLAFLGGVTKGIQKASTANAVASLPKLRIKSWEWAKTSTGFVETNGEIENISNERLEKVMAVVVFRDSKGELIDSDSTWVDFSPLRPGEKSPWKVLTPWHPAMQSASVKFKTLGGAEIPSVQAPVR